MTLRRRTGPSRPVHGPRRGAEKLRAPATDAALRSSPVDPLTEKQIRTSFVNSTKGEATRLRLPLDFAELPWPDLDFLGWVDPGAPLRAHLVVPRADDTPLGISLRVPAVGRTSAMKSSLCQICLTGHASSGVTLFTAPLAGPRGRQGNTVGIYLCADLACPLYVRGKRQPLLRSGRQEESLTVEERVERMMGNLEGFTAKVVGG
ncbi:hypothetical protein C0Q60_17500 [Streptomyces albidoflavus]|nr:hypothetical protein C0Q61_17150 [Streptomyces albidoflavus]RZD78453.1 hypothetical protein C0Q60_17500 [Streptomyces albidoflavus]RZD84641.1 hypothetical protein C0Q63_16805 [Streptomyces albidoflavus]RZD96388.1 hypothetical protein C0Q62_17375 [Streptomyces albidoflavus]RZE11279.1 hypothetical protein C0Q66_17660 [Streptomyces albidoflavus]